MELHSASDTRTLLIHASTSPDARYQRDDGSKKRAEEQVRARMISPAMRLADQTAQAKAITDLTASLESERKRRQSLEAEVEKIKQQLDEQKQRFEKQVRLYWRQSMR